MNTIASFTPLRTPVPNAGGRVFQLARERAAWAHKSAKSGTTFGLSTPGCPPGASDHRQDITHRGQVDLAGLKPDDVRVEVVWGQVGINGTLVNTEVTVLNPVARKALTVYSHDSNPARPAAWATLFA